MSMTTTYACDHCGAPCNGAIYASLWGDGDETKAYRHTRLDGCSQEHLGLVLAKSFGFASNSPANEVQDAERTQFEKTIEQQKARIEELTGYVVDNQKAVDEYVVKLRHAETRIAELEKRLAPPIVDGKTPGEVVFEARNMGLEHAFRPWTELDNDLKPRWETAAKAVLETFGKRQVREALERVLDDVASISNSTDASGINTAVDIVRDSVCDFIDAELAKLGTEPTSEQSPKRMKYDRDWLLEQTDDALFDLYMQHIGFFDMNGTMVERENMIETLASIETKQDSASITIPTKPTKPLLKTAVDSLESLVCAYQDDAPRQLTRGEFLALVTLRNYCRGEQ